MELCGFLRSDMEAVSAARRRTSIGNRERRLTRERCSRDVVRVSCVIRSAVRAEVASDGALAGIRPGVHTSPEKR